MICLAPHAPPNDYPAGDGKPIWETDWHRNATTRLLGELGRWYRDDPGVYVSGGLLVFYREGDRRARVTPDVFVVKGVPKISRDNFLVWQEGRTPDLAIELTSRKTRRTDREWKLPLYRDVLKVSELFLFDPREEYLNPSFQGYRRSRGKFVRIKPTNGRLASTVLGLHLERDGTQLRLWDPATGDRVPTPGERARDAEDRANSEGVRADAEADRADRLQRELDELRRKLGGA